MIAIALFLKGGRVSRERIDVEIKRVFRLQQVRDIRNNMFPKKDFLVVYKKVYKETFELIMEGIKNESEQKKAD